MNIGDAVCTIAAASTFSEPFVIETKYLRPMHRNYAGKRCSDHIALFMAFQQWLKAKWYGEQSEQEFCERKALNMQILRMTFEARNQLKVGLF
jgi:ATP-dependent RNA helicase A